MRRKIHVSADLLRATAALFIAKPGKVHYEKVLSFLASSYKDKLPGSKQADDSSSQTSKSRYNPLTHAELESNQTDRGHPHQRDDAKLLRLVHNNLANVSSELDMSRVHQIFQARDREHRGMMSADQIKEAAYTSRIPLQESILNQILARCDASNGQYRWQQFVEFIERVQPSVTGLPIPESKKPLEYAIQRYTPSSWPRTDGPSPSPRRISDNAADSINSDSQRNKTPDIKSAPISVHSEVDPNDELSLSHPRKEHLSQLETKLQKQAEIDKLENELLLLESEYETQKQTMKQQEKEVARKEKMLPWLDRFMKLANAIYANDSSNAGYLKDTEMAWLTEQYNVNYELGISQSNIDMALKQCNTDRDRVTIDSYLKMLSSAGP